MYESYHCLGSGNKNIYLDWSRKLSDLKARIAIDRRMNRMELDNFGNHKFAAMASGKCASMSVRDIGCITP